MSATRIHLDLIEVPSPCTVPWDSMTGTDRVRHCGQCAQYVYQLSNLSRQEAEELIREKEGKLCVQFYRRPDGSVVTRDCVAVRWWRGSVSAVTLVGLGVLALLGLASEIRSSAESTFSFVGGSIKPPAGGASSGSSHSTTPAPREKP